MEEIIRIGLWVLILDLKKSQYNAVTYDVEFTPYCMITCTGYNTIPKELEILSMGPWASEESFKEFLNWAHRLDPDTSLWRY